MATPQLGDVFVDSKGVLFETVAICTQPTMTLRELRGVRTQKGRGRKQEITGVIDSDTFKGFKKLVPERAIS